jgi:hypothetical protein
MRPAEATVFTTSYTYRMKMLTVLHGPLRPLPFSYIDTIGSSAALRRVRPPEKRVFDTRGAGSVPFMFHRNPHNIAGSTAQSCQVSTDKASVPAIKDGGYSQSSARIVGCASRSIASLCLGRYVSFGR